MKGTLFDIQRFSVHDGEGIRTNLFFKGCPLRCDWCSNPESWITNPQPFFEQLKCIHCGACIADCGYHAIIEDDQGARSMDLKKCMPCKERSCVKRCYAKALKIAGKEYSTEEIIDIAERDRAFYSDSGGGVTFTGGEALCQIDFLMELLQALKKCDINTAIETCMCVPWADIERTLPFMDTYLCDVKHIDALKMKQNTGVDGTLILQNIRRLAQSGASIIARVPVIPMFNDSAEEIEQIGKFVLDCGIKKINLLAFHRLGVSKYKKIFYSKEPSPREPLEESQMDSFILLLRGMGLEAEIS